MEENYDSLFVGRGCDNKNYLKVFNSNILHKRLITIGDYDFNRIEGLNRVNAEILKLVPTNQSYIDIISPHINRSIIRTLLIDLQQFQGGNLDLSMIMCGKTYIGYGPHYVDNGNVNYSPNYGFLENPCNLVIKEDNDVEIVGFHDRNIIKVRCVGDFNENTWRVLKFITIDDPVLLRNSECYDVIIPNSIEDADISEYLNENNSEEMTMIFCNNRSLFICNNIIKKLKVNSDVVNVSGSSRLESITIYNQDNLIIIDVNYCPNLREISSINSSIYLLFDEISFSNVSKSIINCKKISNSREDVEILLKRGIRCVSDDMPNWIKQCVNQNNLCNQCISVLLFSVENNNPVNNVRGFLRNRYPNEGDNIYRKLSEFDYQIENNMAIPSHKFIIERWPVDIFFNKDKPPYELIVDYIMNRYPTEYINILDNCGCDKCRCRSCVLTLSQE